MWEYSLLKLSTLTGIMLLKKLWIEMFYFVLYFAGKAAQHAGN